MSAILTVEYPILNALSLEMDPTGHRYKLTKYDNGATSTEYWSDYLGSATADHLTLPVGSTVTVSVALTKYDGSPVDMELPGNIPVHMQVGQSAPITAQATNGSAALSYTGTAAGTVTIFLYGDNDNIRANALTVTFQ